ncbi:bifunctional 4-hydroxy-2-oxoglutarate aldolase/2-dehydro-3-deoxy-phosphogluconate aldolase [Lactobacillus hominis]|uniref:bifunctional 4-hydroxy-2-oxoglutarate aldolase/2-dehydro-3-deoxy-phosphogluconate aldolase n=1 Tax=Lactobacillus hominis TaxID=1203033 RepID=UPI0023F4BFF4|nr:bifunctional 4-hydroxy-2-oxoglutarate aldolase/2-dehydro-3-deoxy-phosphogluconate aldolase [Lactobacillus hominis]
MQKTDLLNKLVKAGVVAVIRANDKEKAIKTVDAVIKGGITAIELTFTVPGADEVIATLSKKYKDNDQVVIGAGTVLDASSARLAIISGAQFIVSSSFNEEVAKISNLYCIPYTPGCMTPTEVQTALTYGSELVKIFPGDIMGKASIKDLKGPFPYLNIMPSGGVSLNNMQDWFEAGASVVGVGGNLIKDAENGDFEAVSDMAKKYHQKFLNIMA